MTQKRGLGRGLGALIPGAGSVPATEQELRARGRSPAESGEQAASNRPVDMFFSGEKAAADDERPQRERGNTQDLADAMARAAAERRGRGAATPRSSSPRSTEQPAKSASKSAPAKTAPAKSTPSKSRTAKPSPASSTSTNASTSKRSAAKSPTATKPSTDASTDRPVVDVETVEPTPTTSAVIGQSTGISPPAEVAPRAELPTVDALAEEDAAPAAATAAGATENSVSETPASEATVPAGSAVDRSVPDTSGVDTGTSDADVDASDETGDGGPFVTEHSREDLIRVPGAVFAEIPIHEIRENPRNPRMMFDDDELDELAFSLREVGVLQPVVVRPVPVTPEGESFELVMGERRWRAARRAGLTSIPAIIRETSDDDLLRDALLENLHRTQLNPLEEANAYQQLLEDFGCTQDELGERIGRSRPQITNTLRLLRLPALVQRRLASGAISAGHARALLSLDDPTMMEELAQRIVSEGLSVRAVEGLVARRGQQPSTRTARRSTYDPHVVDLTSRLSNRLETQVRIDVGKRKGRITVEFSNLDDLERLVESMGIEGPLPQNDEQSQD